MMPSRASTSPSPATTVVVPRTVFAPVGGFHGIAELWRGRRLVLLLARFELRRRYTNPVARVVIVIAQPAIVTALAALAFGVIGRPPSAMAYPVYVFSGLVPWQLIQSALVGSDAILSSRERFVPRVHVPSTAVPFAAVGVSLVEVVPTLAVLAILAVYFGVPLDGPVVTLPLWLLFAGLTALGAALWLMPLRIRHARVASAVPFVSLAWLLASPVFWGDTVAPPSQPIFALNPMFAVVHGIRWALFGEVVRPDAIVLAGSLATVTAMLATGWLYCRRDRLGDVLEFRIVRRGPRQ